MTPIAVAVIAAELSAADAAECREMPAMIYRRGGDDTVDIYAVPPVRYPDGRWYVKLGIETLPERELGDAGAVAEWMSGDAPTWRPHLEAGLHELLPNLRFTRSVIKPCIYTRTPHRYPFIDHVADRIVVAAGGNGRAAKSADAIGAIAVRLVESGGWTDGLDATAFALP
jgi:sarcosine oxidase